MSEIRDIDGWKDLGEVLLPFDLPAHRYSKGELKVLVGQEDRFCDGRLLWHLSISHPSRYPDWDEIKGARYALLPLDIYVAMILPPPEEYTNVHPNCFHLWQTSDQRT